MRTSEESLKVLVVDDHAILRAGLRQLLVDEFSSIAVAEAGTTAEALEKLWEQKWNAVILDIHMPDRSGLEVLEAVRKSLPEVPVLVLSSTPEEQIAVRVLMAGAAGYLNKIAAPEELVTAMQHILKGGRYISVNVAERLVAEVAKPGGRAPHQLLSTREFEVFERMASGQSLKHIAGDLSLSVKTISTFRSRVFKKLALHSDIDLANYVHEHGLFGAGLSKSLD